MAQISERYLLQQSDADPTLVLLIDAESGLTLDTFRISNDHSLGEVLNGFLPAEEVADGFLRRSLDHLDLTNEERVGMLFFLGYFYAHNGE